MEQYITGLLLDGERKRVVDDTDCPKKGAHAVRVARQ